MASVQASPRSKRLWTMAALVVASAILASQLGGLVTAPGLLADDFVEYWAAGRLNVTGGDPYAADDLLPLERHAGRTAEVLMMWNPPWTLALVMPFSLLSYPISRLLWLGLSIVLIIVASNWIWELFGGMTNRRWLAWALAFTFFPTIIVLRMGQIGPVLLLGVAGFLHFERKERYGLAGALLALLAIKPHLLYLVCLAVPVWCLGARRRWAVLGGATIALVAATLTAMVFNPQVISQYRAATEASSPLVWMNPTAGSLLRWVFGPELIWLQFAPMAAGVGWLALYGRKHRAAWLWADRIGLLLLVSVVTAPFGWPFDQVVLVPVVLQIACLARGTGAAPIKSKVWVVYALTNLVAIALHGRVSDFWQLWFAPVLLAWYLVARHSAGGHNREGIMSKLSMICGLAVLIGSMLVAGQGAAAAAAANASAEPPVLISPPDGSTATGVTDPPLGMPTLRWQAVSGATKYHIQISSSAGFASPIVDRDTFGISFIPDAAFADGVYYWRVRAWVGFGWEAYSDAWSFTKDWCAAGAIRPQLLSPINGEARAAFLPQDFSWTAIPGAATYRLDISPDAAFSNIIYSATTIRAHHTPTDRFANNLYYWRVIPIDRRNNLGTASDIGQFRFDWNVAPELLAPSHMADLTFMPRFSWTAVESAREYLLEISTQPDFSASLNAYTTDHTDFTPVKSLANDQDYYWRVRATDYRGVNGPWSQVRRFRMRWNFHAGLLAPLNNTIRVSYPFFDWAQIPGAERYQIQIDESTSFNSPIADEKIYNATAWAQPRWENVLMEGDYFWRVRGIDAQGNLTPWSDLRSFRPSYTTSPNQIYPPFYYEPEAAHTPVHGDRTIAWPLFVWDTAQIYESDPAFHTLTPDLYELSVDDDPAFGSPNMMIQTAGNAAAPTEAHPFSGLVDGTRFYWRVRAYRGGQQMGTDSVWVMRYDNRHPQLPVTDTMTLIQPIDGFEAVGIPPILGWLPITNATSYRVQISRDRGFTQVVDEAVAQGVNYVPWQGRPTPMPFGTFWWRVRSETPPGPWSEVRRFNVSIDVIAGNPYDYSPPPQPGSLVDTTATYAPATTLIAVDPAEPALGAYDLGALHVMLDRTYSQINYNWVIAFETAATSADALTYGLYVDIDHVEGSGAATDPRGWPITTDALYRPEYVLYIAREAGDAVSADTTSFHQWNGASWEPPRTLTEIGGQLWLDPVTRALQLLMPYTALGAEDPKAAGSLALTAFTASGALGVVIQDHVPEQGATFDRPAFVSDMLMPLYPFDTPVFNPTVLYDMPALRWRMPALDSVDGYQVQVARDAKFTQIAETWETYETYTWPFYALLPASFATKNAYEDNESYYWRVRIRHERYLSLPPFYDYGPWSPAMRFRLDSRLVGNPQPGSGAVTQSTPTFTWDRVEGAAGYVLQLDNDANFSSPIINTLVDGVSFTPTDVLADGMYYWRVAMRRSNTVIGHWTPTMTFTKLSAWPVPLTPLDDAVVNSQPTFGWQTLLLPDVEPRLAAPRYRLQLASDPGFSSPRIYDTAGTSYTLKRGQSLSDGAWYWRVAILDANNGLGAYGPTRRVYKEYLPPTLIAPSQGAEIIGTPVFEWAPMDGAAYYRLQTADNALFNNATTVTTDNTRYAPLNKLAQGVYYWRVQMIDADSHSGPYEVGRVRIGATVYLPLLVR